MTTIRTYSEMVRLGTLDDRYEYLALAGEVGHSTFGYDRHINQAFYRSKEWRTIRDFVIVRDDGNDMALPDFPVRGAPQIHHMNPLTMDDFEDMTDNLLDPEFLVCVSKRTHNAIHFGDRTHLPHEPIVRVPGDTRLW